jgi:hypothetical protein
MDTTPASTSGITSGKSAWSGSTINIFLKV